MYSFKLIIAVWFVGVLFSGCLVSKVVEGEPGTCEVHNIRLHKSLVRVKYGAYCAPGTHLGKGSEAFPNAKHPVCGGCVVRKKIRWFYNCSKCNKAKRSNQLQSIKNGDRNNEIRSKF
jgi:hypothetical protein